MNQSIHTHALICEKFLLPTSKRYAGTCAGKEGVTNIFPATGIPGNSGKMFELEKKFPNKCFATWAGLHPRSVKKIIKMNWSIKLKNYWKKEKICSTSITSKIDSHRQTPQRTHAESSYAGQMALIRQSVSKSSIHGMLAAENNRCNYL